MFCADAKRLGHSTSITPYLKILKNVEQGETFALPNAEILRLESPGEDAVINGKLLELGGAFQALSRGEVRDQIAWMNGFSKLLNSIQAKHAFISPMDIRTMFDKLEMYERLKSKGCPLPERLPSISSIKHLKEIGKPIRIFIKPRYGSSASGVLACSIKKNFVKCITSLEINGTRFFNSLKMRTYVGKDAEKCINFVLSEGAVVEKWFPKATLKMGAFDLRIVCIDGKAAHKVVRVSRSPMTNLHLGNARGTLKQVEERLGTQAIERAIAAAESAAAAFPLAHYMGVDVALNPSGKTAIVLEVNAFGDLLPGILYNGQSTYSEQISSFVRK